MDMQRRLRGFFRSIFRGPAVRIVSITTIIGLTGLIVYYSGIFVDNSDVFIRARGVGTILHQESRIENVVKPKETKGCLDYEIEISSIHHVKDFKLNGKVLERPSTAHAEGIELHGKLFQHFTFDQLIEISNMAEMFAQDYIYDLIHWKGPGSPVSQFVFVCRLILIVSQIILHQVTYPSSMSTMNTELHTVVNDGLEGTLSWIAKEIGAAVIITKPGSFQDPSMHLH
jgi:hypothetical protein